MSDIMVTWQFTINGKRWRNNMDESYYTLVQRVIHFWSVGVDVETIAQFEGIWENEINDIIDSLSPYI